MPSVITDLRDDGIAVITLNEPDQRNALNADIVGDIQVAFDWLERDESHCSVAVITGAPPAFCAGANLGNLAAATQSSLGAIYQGFLRVAASRLPTIAAVNGAAVGAGVNLALCCDVILCGESARIDTRFLKLGIHPGGGHTWMMRRHLGPQMTKAAVLFGEVWNGREAERVGFAYRCVPDDELLPLALELAGRVAAADDPLTERIKQTIDHMATIQDHDQAVANELQSQLWSMTLPGFTDKITAAQAEVSSSDGTAQP